MTYKIQPARGHFEVYINGKFYCSADDWKEAVREVEDYAKGGSQNESQSAQKRLWNNRTL